MREGLVAVRRADKNGVVRTKWVRPESAQPRSLPPAAATPPAPAPTPRAAAVTLQEFDDLLGNFHIGDPSIVVDMRDMLAGMPEDAADALVVALWEHEGFANLPAAQEAVEAVYGPGSRVPISARDMTMRNWGALIPDPDSLAEDSTYSVLSHVSIVFAALGGFDGGLGTRALSDAEREAYTAAVRVACAVSGDPADSEEALAERGFGRHGDERLHLLERGGLDLFAKHSDSTHAIEAELIARGTMATDVVRAVAQAGPLARGAL